MVGQALVRCQRRALNERPIPKSRTPGPAPDHRAAPPAQRRTPQRPPGCRASRGRPAGERYERAALIGYMTRTAARAARRPETRRSGTGVAVEGDRGRERFEDTRWRRAAPRRWRPPRPASSRPTRSAGALLRASGSRPRPDMTTSGTMRATASRNSRGTLVGVRRPWRQVVSLATPCALVWVAGSSTICRGFAPAGEDYARLSALPGPPQHILHSERASGRLRTITRLYTWWPSGGSAPGRWSGSTRSPMHN